MKIGFPNNPRRNVLTEIAWIGENGFDFVDLFLEPDKAALEAIDPAAIRREIARAGLGAIGHLAWYLPIGSPLPQLREAAVATAGAYLGVFREIGVGAVTVHANWPPGMFSEDEGVAWQTQSLRDLVRRAEALRIRLMYEPIDTRRDSPENVECILNQVPGLLCHLDTGHCNLFGRRPGPMIRQFGSRLNHLHVHDNDGLYDQHLPPGTGRVDWEETFAALRAVYYDKTITLEVFSQDRDYVLFAKTKIERLIGETSARS
jgi:sugar phosphate isomerase/epimerase